MLLDLSDNSSPSDHFIYFDVRNAAAEPTASGLSVSLEGTRNGSGSRFSDSGDCTPSPEDRDPRDPYPTSRNQHSCFACKNQIT